MEGENQEMPYSKKTVNTMIKDEREAVQDYKRRGLTKFAREEAGHLAYWERQKEKQKK